MRALWLALAATLLLAGCGNDNNTVSTFNTTNTAATSGLLIDQARAVQFAQVLSGVTITTGALTESQATASNVLQTLDGGRPVALMTGIMAQLPGLSQGGTRVINGSLHGKWRTADHGDRSQSDGVRRAAPGRNRLHAGPDDQFPAADPVATGRSRPSRSGIWQASRREIHSPPILMLGPLPQAFRQPHFSTRTS